jgi:hypothetical protein
VKGGNRSDGGAAEHLQQTGKAVIRARRSDPSALRAVSGGKPSDCGAAWHPQQTRESGHPRAVRHGHRSNFGEAAVQTERSEIIASSVVRTGRDNRKPHKVVIIAIANAILKTRAVWRQQLNR